MRVGFLFNHDQLHQVAHLLPVALALAEMRPSFELVLATTSDALTSEVRRLAGCALERIELVQLGITSPITRIAARASNTLFPAHKILIYRDNLAFFERFDALVVAEKTSLILRNRYGLSRLKLIHTRHGAGDRAIGFNAQSRQFDLVLAAGEVIRDRLIGEAGLRPDQVAVVGYPKFDVLPPIDSEPLFAADTRPTVLYNPHVAPHLSSWYRDGRKILQWFAKSARYNLIFAPHVMLFQRPLALTIDPPRLHRPGRIPRSVADLPHIHVDVSSPACTDMTYTRSADIYLGDASSQVYEFLSYPRPCLFFDSHNFDYNNKEHLAHWQAGQVVYTVPELEQALDRAIETFPQFRERQESLFSAHISLTEEPSSIRAARAIVRLLGSSRKSLLR